MASEETAITNKITYLETTKEQIKNALNQFNISPITENDTFRDYVLKIKNIYNNWPKATDSNSMIVLNNTKKSKMIIKLKGNISQSETPTPISPVPVNIVSGDNIINISNKNIFKTHSLIGSAGISHHEAIPDGYSITASNTAGTGIWVILEIGNLNDYENKTLTFSMSNTPNAIYKSIQFMGCDEDGGNRHEIGNSLGSNSNILTTTITNQYNSKKLGIRLYITNPVRGDTYNFNNIQIEINSSKTIYEAPNKDVYHINLPVENLLNLETLIDGGGSNMSTVEITNEKIILARENPSTYQYKKFITDLDINQYKGKTLSFNCSINNNNSRAFLGLYNNNKQLIGDLGKTLTIPTNTEATYIGLQLYQSYGTAVIGSVEFSNLMLEIGSKNNSYVPYGTTPIELCTGDYFYKEENNWYKYENIYKIKCNDTTGFFAYSAGDTENKWSYRTYQNKIPNAKDSLSYSDYFSGTVDSRIYGTSAGRLYLEFPKNIGLDMSNATLLNAWLSIYEPVAYYLLNEPRIVPITYQPLIEQLNLIENAISKENQTIIYQTNNNDLSFIIEASALLKKSN